MRFHSGVAVILSSISVVGYAGPGIERWKDFVREHLKDPKSAEFRNVYPSQTPKGTPAICGEVNSKNAFGGYTGYKPFIIFADAEMLYLEVPYIMTMWENVCER